MLLFFILLDIRIKISDFKIWKRKRKIFSKIKNQN